MKIGGIVLEDEIMLEMLDLVYVEYDVYIIFVKFMIYV